MHLTIDYPSIPINRSLIRPYYDVLKSYEIPVRPHFGIVAVAPMKADIFGSNLLSYAGGNFNNWRAGKGANCFFLVSVASTMFSTHCSHCYVLVSTNTFLCSHFSIFIKSILTIDFGDYLDHRDRHPPCLRRLRTELSRS